LTSVRPLYVTSMHLSTIGSKRQISPRFGIRNGPASGIADASSGQSTPVEGVMVSGIGAARLPGAMCDARLYLPFSARAVPPYATSGVL
jgi:hypothetical protein